MEKLLRYHHLKYYSLIIFEWAQVYGEKLEILWLVRIILLLKLKCCTALVERLQQYLFNILNMNLITALFFIIKDHTSAIIANHHCFFYMLSCTFLIFFTTSLLAKWKITQGIVLCFFFWEIHFLLLPIFVCSSFLHLGFIY